MNKKNSLEKADIFWNFTGTVFNMGINFMILPILLRFLNTDSLGVWYVMNSFAGIANLFTFGFIPAFARNVSYSWNGALKLERVGKSSYIDLDRHPNFPLLKTVIYTSKLIFGGLATISLFFVGILGTIHMLKITIGVKDRFLWISWIIFLAAIFLNIFYGYYSSFLIGIGRIKISNQILVLSGIIRIVVMFLFMSLKMGILGASLAYLVYGICYRVLSKFYFEREVLHEKEQYAYINSKFTVRFEDVKNCFFSIWHNAWRDGVVTVSVFLQTQMSTLVCSSFLSLSETAFFALTMQLIDAIGKISSSVYYAYVPRFQKGFIQGNIEDMRKNHAFCIISFLIIYLSGCLFLILVGIPIISLIKRELVIQMGVFIGYAIYQFMLTYRNCHGVYLSCTNRVIYYKSYVITGFLSVVIYTVLFQVGAGIWGVILTSILMESAYNFWKYPIMIKQELELNEKEILKIGLMKAKEILHERNKQKF